jgi:phosphate starvation-inducible PhoH-like protein
VAASPGDGPSIGLDLGPHEARLDTQTRRVTVGFNDAEGMRELCGERDRNLRWLESRLGISVLARGSELRLHGGGEDVGVAADLLRAMTKRISDGGSIDDDTMHRFIEERTGQLAENRRQGTNGKSHDLGHGGRTVSARTEGQRRYVQALRNNDVVFGVGPAGTGKTFLAVASAVTALHRREIKRIVLTRPAVEAGERLGFLPGDLAAKVNPYLRPLLDALDEMLDRDRVERMIERGQVEVAPLAFMRGRTLSASYVILDEAQNCTIEQMAMFLTRIGPHSKAVVTGDMSQSDLPRGRDSGLNHAVSLLEGIRGIDVVYLDQSDVVRHPLVARIADAYERDAARRREGG